MKRLPSLPNTDTEPSVATWELWIVGQTLITTRGDEAEAHAQAKLAEAETQSDEAAVLVWSGVITQLRHIRRTSSST